MFKLYIYIYKKKTYIKKLYIFIFELIFKIYRGDIFTWFSRLHSNRYHNITIVLFKITFLFNIIIGTVNNETFMEEGHE